MTRLGMFRGMSHVFACLGVRRDGGGDPTDRLQDKRRKVRGGRTPKKARASTMTRKVHFSIAPCDFSQGIAASKLLTPCNRRPPIRSHDRARWRAIRPFCLDQAPWHTAAMDCPRTHSMSTASAPLGCALDLIAEGGA